MKLCEVRLEEILAQHGLGSRVGTRAEGHRVQTAVLGKLAECDAPLIAIDLAGLEVINSSFADEVIALPLQRVYGGEYGERYLVVVTPIAELVADFRFPLEKRDLTLLVFEGSVEGPWQVLGVAKSYFTETLAEIMRRGAVTTGDLASVLGISDQNCSNRLAALGKRRLIQREREFGVRGGQTHLNRSLLDLAT
jgi:hypothetical protein